VFQSSRGRTLSPRTLSRRTLSPRTLSPRTLSRGTLSRRMLIAVAVALVPLAAGCEAGISAPTQQWHQPTDGTNATVGGITISDAFVLGAPLNQSLIPGQAAGLYLGIVNSGPTDHLLSISAPGTAASVSLPGGTIALPSRQAVLLTGPKPAIVLENLSLELTGGSVVRLTLTFENAGTVRLDVPVMPQAQYYATFSPAPTASPTASPAPSGTGPARHHRRGSRSASPSPSSSP
jgi:copper(I)-binding protein